MTTEQIFGSKVHLVAVMAVFLNLTLVSAPAKPPVKAPDLATIVAFLQPASPILTVGNMTLTWQEFAPVMQRLSTSQSKYQSPPEQVRRKLRKTLQSYASRGLLLQEVRALKLTVTPEDKQRFEAELEHSLKGNNRGLTKEKFIKSFSTSGSTMLNLSYEDALLLQKLNQVKFSQLEVPADMVNRARKYLVAVNQSLQRQNDVRKTTCKKIIANPRAKTDKGFANLVKEYSEGIEARWGGELKYDFTREELASVCYMDNFTFKVGENTPVCETNSAFRILRVLREVPQPNGQPTKLRVAQILIAKVPTQDTSEAAIKARLQKELTKLKISQFIQELTAKYPVKTLFFPEGLWPRKDSAMTTAPTQKGTDK